MATQTQIDSIAALVGAPSRARNDQGEFQFDILDQVRALKLLGSIQTAAAGPSFRRQMFSSMCNRFKPPGI